MRIRYLNTDLDLSSKEDLRPLARALIRQGVYKLSVDQASNRKWYATFELDTVGRRPNVHVNGILKAIESLRGKARTLWDNCTLRELNIGYDSGVKPWHVSHAISTRLLERMAKVGLSLRITIYKVQPDDRKP